MNKYPLWKYILILAVTVTGLLYALPNLFGDDPAIQISGTRSATVDKALETRFVPRCRRMAWRRQPPSSTIKA